MPNVEALKVNYQPCPDFNMDLESNFGNNLKLAATANVPRIPFLLGFSGALDLGKFALTKQEFAMNYNQGNTNLTCSTALAGDMKCLIFNKINPSLSLATMINHTAAGTNLAIAGASAGACGSSNQFKVDNQGRMALSHITPTNIYGAKLTVSAEFNAFNLDAGDHKLGWGMKFDL